MTRDEARLWLSRCGKTPCPQGSESHPWRWVLPRLGYTFHPGSAHELPGDVFDLLESDHPRFPWLFTSKEAAIEGAIVALVKQISFDDDRSV